jgi:hypothetical protein
VKATVKEEDNHFIMDSFKLHLWLQERIMAMQIDEIRITLRQGYRTRLDCAAPQSQPTFIQFPSGMIIAPGSIAGYNSNLTNARTTNVYVYGYLTTGK